MNFRKYYDFIFLLILFQIISTSSANEWKKLKRKLFALTLLHGIRVKTIIPFPVPLPLPIVIKKDIDPIVLPPKRVPFLVPKPVPYYQIIPKFVPIDSKDTTTNGNHWPQEEGLLSAPQMTHENYLLPTEVETGLGHDYYKLAISDGQHPKVKHNFEQQNKHNGHHDQFIDPFEQNSRHKFPTNKRKSRKRNRKPLKGFHENEGERYEDLMMVSTALKTQPQEEKTIHLNEGNTRSIDSINKEMTDHLTGMSSDYPNFGHLINDSKTEIQKNKANGINKQLIDTNLSESNVKTKKIKVGELRIHSHHLKTILENHNNYERQ